VVLKMLPKLKTDIFERFENLLMKDKDAICHA
jgi:hypothetical protein